ncbi:MAG: hypothetical protein J6O50_13955 [Ruminiclostridium sp.]|nr:hypothetical protein [Ruminiclostridium sp.]
MTRFAVFRLLIEVIDSAAELSACITLLITLYVPTFFKLLYSDIPPNMTICIGGCMIGRFGSFNRGKQAKYLDRVPNDIN